MATVNKDTGTLLLIVGGVLLYFYLTKPKGNALQKSGCGCGGAAVNATTPTTPAMGRSASPTLTSSAGANGTAAADYGGPAAPGSNTSAPGSGAQWQGVRQRRQTPLTPTSAPSSPSTPVGSNVWSANATPIGVSA
jgi:hypothetical protein